MLVESGEVTQARPGHAVIKMQQSSSCRSCTARGMCLAFGGTERSVEVRDPFGAAVGDQVEIGIVPGRVVQASILAYILPVVAMLAGAFAGSWLAPVNQRDLGSFLGTLAMLALSLGGLWLANKIRGFREEELPVVLRVQEPGRGVGPDQSIRDDIPGGIDQISPKS